MKPWRIEEGAELDFAEALDFYREESDALAGRLYLAIAHFKRRPGYWRERLR